MARLMTFRTLVQESIANSDAKEFQNVVKQKLTESLKKHKKQMIRSIQEELDVNFSKAVEVGNASKAFGSKMFVYEDGILHITVPTADAVEHLADYLDECNEVESYEVHALVEDDPEGSPIDIQTIKNHPDTNFEFSVYFGVGVESVSESRVTFLEEKDEDEEEDEEDEDEDEDEDDEDAK